MARTTDPHLASSVLGCDSDFGSSLSSLGRSGFLDSSIGVVTSLAQLNLEGVLGACDFDLSSDRNVRRSAKSLKLLLLFDAGFGVVTEL